MTAVEGHDQGDDRSLVEALERDDELAFGELRRRHLRAVLGVARRTAHDGAIAQQVAEEVFVALWQSPGRFDPSRGSLRTWLLIQARRRAVDVVRSEEARRRREDVVGRRELFHAPDGDGEVVDPCMVGRVHEALGALRSDEAAAIRLAYFEGHTYLEVARLLEQPEGTIKTKIRAAMGILRVELADLNPRA
jgi:RNA polymerase sigma-70 factor (ECF subfamily)